jgi:hypothetical protein
VEQILWIGLGLATLVSSVFASNHPRALQVGRIALGLLFLVGGALVNLIFLVGDTDFADFADDSPWTFIAETWRSVVAPRQLLFIGLLIAFEATVGILVLVGGRLAEIGMVAIMGFHVGLLFFAWYYWPWSALMLIALGLLLRAQHRETGWHGTT